MSDKLSKVYRTDPFGFPLHAADEEIFRSLSVKASTATSDLPADMTDMEMTDIEQTNEAIDTPETEIMDRGDAEI